jgi:hypothetical protein
VEPPPVEGPRSFSAGTLTDLDALRSEPVGATPGLVRRFRESDDDSLETGGQDRIGTGRGFAVVGAGLEGHIESTAACTFTSLGEGDDFGVGPPECGVVTLTRELSLGVDDDRANHRIRGSAAASACSELEGAVHPAKVWIVLAGMDGARVRPDPLGVGGSFVSSLRHPRVRRSHSVHLNSHRLPVLFGYFSRVDLEQ